MEANRQYMNMRVPGGYALLLSELIRSANAAYGGELIRSANAATPGTLVASLSIMNSGLLFLVVMFSIWLVYDSRRSLRLIAKFCKLARPNVSGLICKLCKLARPDVSGYIRWLVSEICPASQVMAERDQCMLCCAYTTRRCSFGECTTPNSDYPAPEFYCSLECQNSDAIAHTMRHPKCGIAYWAKFLAPGYFARSRADPNAPSGVWLPAHVEQECANGTVRDVHLSAGNYTSDEWDSFNRPDEYSTPPEAGPRLHPRNPLWLAGQSFSSLLLALIHACTILSHAVKLSFLLVLVFIFPCSAQPVVNSGQTYEQTSFMATSPIKPFHATSAVVDTGSYPRGIYNIAEAFTSFSSDVSSVAGLYGDSSCSLGEVTLWLPVLSPAQMVGWKSITMPNQLFEPKSRECLYSTHDGFAHGGVRHGFDDEKTILFPDGSRSPMHPDARNGYRIHVVVGGDGEPPPLSMIPSWVHSSRLSAVKCAQRDENQTGYVAHSKSQLPIEAVDSDVHPSVLSKSELRAWRLMGFPFNRQWKAAVSKTIDHGLQLKPGFLPQSVNMFTEPKVLLARMRCLPFHRKLSRMATAVGHLVWIDFHGPLVRSRIQQFIGHFSIIDDFSRLGFMFPVHNFTAETAKQCVLKFRAILTMLMKLSKPLHIVELRSDNAQAFCGRFFGEFCDNMVTAHTFAAAYAHAMMGRIERMHGVRMGTTRLLLMFANLTRGFWPYASNMANVIHNKLPVLSLEFIPELRVTRALSVSWKHLYIFGSRCLFWLDPAQRPSVPNSQALLDRALKGSYLGPVLLKSASHIFVPHYWSSTGREYFTTASSIRVDESAPPPGLLNETYDWAASLISSSPLSDDASPPNPSSMATAAAELDRHVVEPDEVTEAEPNAAPDFLPSNYVIDPDEPSPGGDQDPNQDSNQVSTSSVVSPATPKNPLGTGVDLTTPFANHGDKKSFRGGHCDTSDCLLPKGHPGVCQNMLPADGGAPRHMSVPTGIKLHARKRVQASSFKPHSSQFQPGDNQRGDVATSPHISIDIFDEKLPASVRAASAVSLAVSTASELPSFCYRACVNALIATVPNAMASSIPIPKGYISATMSPYASYWLDAIYREISGLLAMGVWTVMLVRNIPRGARRVRCHYVFTVKTLVTGFIDRFKARLVADGNTQTYGIDYDQVFSTVVKWVTLRICLFFAAIHDFEISGIDISQAFLYGTLDKDIYMDMPQGLPRYDKDGGELCVKLLRTLYGLKQSPRAFNALLLSILLAFGLEQSKLDPCLFTYKSKDGKFILWVLIWVDDLCVITNDVNLRSRFMVHLKNKFKITYQENLDWLLGVKITRNRPDRSLVLSQELYVETLLKKFEGILEGHTKTYSTPAGEEVAKFDPDTDCPTQGSQDQIDMLQYAAIYMHLVGAFLWLTTCTCPHLAYVTSVLARFTINPAKKHLNAAIRVLIYLRSNPVTGIKLGGKNVGTTFRVWVDASWTDKWSVSGALFCIGHSCVNWFTRKQHRVSRSSMEAETFAAAECATEGSFERDLIEELDVPQTTFSILCDAQSTIDFVGDRFACKKSKHFVRDVNFLRDWVARLVVQFKKVLGTLNHADTMTKPLSVGPYTQHMNAILGAKMVPPLQSAPIPSQFAFLSFSGLPFPLVRSDLAESVVQPRRGDETTSSSSVSFSSPLLEGSPSDAG